MEYRLSLAVPAILAYGSSAMGQTTHAAEPRGKVVGPSGSVAPGSVASRVKLVVAEVAKNVSRRCTTNGSSLRAAGFFLPGASKLSFGTEGLKPYPHGPI